MRSKTLGERGYDFVAGLEVEFHLFKLETARLGAADAGQPGEPPEVSLLHPGYQYLTEQRYDELDPILEILRTQHRRRSACRCARSRSSSGRARSSSPSAPPAGLAPADTMVLFRSAIKQIGAAPGYHASFMCRPKLANVMSSGWHLHQSLTDRKSDANAFMPTRRERCRRSGRHYMAGLLAHARGGGRLQHADHQRLQALPALLARARPRHLGARQSRRHAARAGRPGRSGDAHREPGRRADGQPLPLHRVARS